MPIKLQNILLKMANDVLDLDTSGKTLGEPIDEAERAILDLLDKSLDSLEQIDWVPGDDGDFKVREDTEWNAAIETVRQELIDSAKREAIGNHPIVALLRELDDTLPKGKYSTITIKYMPGGKAQLEQSEESI